VKEVTLQLIQQLRERTGIGMMDCKKALLETGGDLEKAVELLRKKGVAVSEKRAGNKTSQGLIHAYIHPGAQMGVLVEINCETDFVARTELLRTFAQDVCMHIAAMKPVCISPEEMDTAILGKERDIQQAKLAEEKKPAHMLEQILEGKMKKFYAEVCLLQQTYIKNDKMTIQDYLTETIAKLGENVKIRRFVRYEIGS